MVADARRRTLGRGLAALLGEDGNAAPEAGAGTLQRIAIHLLEPGRTQPRQRMDDDGLDELARSIAEKGVLQPILVRPHPGQPGRFEIVAGERRWRAAQRAAVHEVPVLIRALDDREAFEVALVENLQRQDLSPLEEAAGYQRLMTEFRRSHDELAQSVGKSRSHVANTIRLLGLPPPVREMIADGTLTAGHGRALLAAADPLAAARAVVKRGLNVRQTERLVRSRPTTGGAGAAAGNADARALARELADRLGMVVDIRHRPSAAGGTLTIRYLTLEQLDDLVARLRRPPA